MRTLKGFGPWPADVSAWFVIVVSQRTMNPDGKWLDGTHVCGRVVKFCTSRYYCVENAGLLSNFQLRC